MLYSNIGIENEAVVIYECSYLGLFFNLFSALSRLNWLRIGISKLFAALISKILILQTIVSFMDVLLLSVCQELLVSKFGVYD